MSKLKLKIVTPERVLLESEVDQVSLPTQVGEITVLPHHIPLVANLAPGEIKVRAGSETKFLAATGGVVEVKSGDEVIILADAAEHDTEIDLARAEEAKDRAQKIMREQVLSNEEYAATAASLEKSLARIRVARRRKHRGSPASG